MKVEQILKIKNAKLINGNKKQEIDNFTINTKEITQNTMFFPLKGTTDGHDYIIDGVKNALAGFFIMPKHEDIIKKALEINPKLIIIEVPNTLKALQNLASETRKNIDVPIIALTGSFGKTSQREMINSVLKEQYTVLSTKGNYNNHIGMPLTLVNYKNEEIILLELGSNHMGEIAFLRNIARPTITLVTNIGTAHIEHFKKIKNTLKEKISIAKGSEYFLRNLDDNLIKKTKPKKCTIIDYSINKEEISNIIYGKKNRYAYKYKDKKYKVNINSDIDYLINYSICAIKIGLLLEMDIKNIIKGISRFKCAPRRMEKIIIGKQLLIDDCYNASYETMINGINYFEKQPYKNKIIILGDILELGKMSKKIHKKIAKHIIKTNPNIEEYHLVGQNMKIVYNILKKNKINAFYYKTTDEINPKILKNKSVYLKGSNGIGLNKIIPPKEK